MTKLLITLTLLLAAAAAAYTVAYLLPSWFWHPLGYCTGTPVAIRDCKGYNLWSGSVSDLSELTIPVALIAAALGWWHQHNCHVLGCPWLQWHPHPEHGHPVCKHHYAQDASCQTIPGEIR